MYKNPYIRVMRIDHYIKQLFIIPGIVVALFFSNKFFQLSTMISIIIGIISVCLISSANYIINEYFDAEFDKYHPTKKNRPMITQNINSKILFLEYFLLAIMGFFISYRISFFFFITNIILFANGILYNVNPIRTKDIFVLDVISESFNSALRFLLGWFLIIDKFLPPSSIVLGYWLFGAFLMAIKRYSEFLMINNKKRAIMYRKSFKKYSEKSLLISAFLYALLSIFFISIFIIKYKIELLLCIPYLCILVCYYIYISDKPDSFTQKPEKLYKEKKLIMLTILFITMIILLLLVDIPFLDKLLDCRLIRI